MLLLLLPRLWSELCGPRCQFRGIFPHFLTACAQFEAGDTIGCLLCLPSLRSSLWFPSQMRNGNISRPETHSTTRRVEKDSPKDRHS